MSSTQSIGWFADLGLTDRPTVGGKGASLGELTNAGIDVPPGFVVTTGQVPFRVTTQKNPSNREDGFALSLLADPDVVI